MTAMKRVRIKVAGSEREVIECQIIPGVTAGEVLAALGLDARMRLTPDPRGSLVWEGEDDLGSEVEDGEQVYAVLVTSVC
jgi:hypothetical protein